MTEEERVKKWSRGISEMDTLSMEEKKIVCHQAAMQMVVLWGALEVIVIGLLVWVAFQYPAIMSGFDRLTDLLNSNFSYSGTQTRRRGAIIVSLPALLPLATVVLIPMIAIFIGCRKHLVRRAARKLSHQWRMETDLKMTRGIAFADVKQGMELLPDDKIQYLGVSPEKVPKELLKNVYWMFNEIIYVSADTFSHDVVEYIEDNQKNWHPGEMAVEAEKIYIIFEAFIIGKEALLANEYVTDISTLEEKCKIDGLFQTDIAALLFADNGKYFTNEELLMKIHNQIAGKKLGNHMFFEGLERGNPLEGISCYCVLLGS
ncbi:hypothetical protein [Acidaminococcus massiliensis]|jgi:hypothetical protein|uniref:hypothetical protein n=1 Tax=Acidaminococcus massiliensis TaxID=1852375 RepID=UPI0023F1EAFE|nr:hypothetical protein [Acidaminococcus massiliensis]